MLSSQVTLLVDPETARNPCLETVLTKEKSIRQCQ